VQGDVIPGQSRRNLAPLTFAESPAGEVRLVPAKLADVADRVLVLPLRPREMLLPGTGWSWSDLAPELREQATGDEDPFSFGHLFMQQLRVELRLTRDGVPLAASEAFVDVCDARRIGSLYQRVVDEVIAADTRAQNLPDEDGPLDASFHPWFPVLRIGADKANLYMNALIEDVVHKQRHLTDPRWLLRVGIYLEFLTCLGIFEAVANDLGDLLSPAERRAFETSPVFAQLREAVDAQAWREVWALRQITPPLRGEPSAGPASLRNLLNKRKTTLAFLKTHHDDLKHAIELSGPNEHNAQETWHRVYRDAERAVLRKVSEVFPELSFLTGKLREFVLWHRKGRLEALGLRWVPEQLSGLFGDQDGLYASASNQYRASMNEVADWAKQRGLMDHTGEECVPEAVSLLQAFMNGESAQVEKLQRRDGYADTLEGVPLPPEELRVSAEGIRSLLRRSPVLGVPDGQGLEMLTASVRPIRLGPYERIAVQGREGSSLFVVAEGSLEVLVREPDGVDREVAILDRGAVFGEQSLLTGERRSATVRSLGDALVYEVAKDAFRTVLERSPALIDQIAGLVERRREENRRSGAPCDARQEAGSLGRRIRDYFFPRD
jgi:hypothetical protein